MNYKSSGIMVLLLSSSIAIVFLEHFYDCSNWDCWASTDTSNITPNEFYMPGYLNVTEAFSDNCYYGKLSIFSVFLLSIVLVSKVSKAIKQGASRIVSAIMLI